MSKLKGLVIGAGLGGLSAGIALSRVGFDVETLKTESDLRKTLQKYEKLRIERTASFVMQSRKSQAMAMIANPIACKLRDLTLKFLPKSLLLKQLHTLSQYDIPDLV